MRETWIRRSLHVIAGSNEIVLASVLLAGGIWMLMTGFGQWNRIHWIEDTAASKSPIAFGAPAFGAARAEPHFRDPSILYFLRFAPTMSIAEQCKAIQDYWPTVLSPSAIVLFAAELQHGTKANGDTWCRLAEGQLLSFPGPESLPAEHESFVSGFVLSDAQQRVVYGSYRITDLQNLRVVLPLLESK